MIDVENIRKAALYYVNNDVTLEDAALYVGIKSKKTLIVILLDYVIQNMKKINYFIKK